MKTLVRVSLVTLCLVGVLVGAATADARARRHHHGKKHHHHNCAGGTCVPTPPPTSPPAGSQSCTISPNPALLVGFPGSFAAALQCQGMGSSNAVTFSSPSLVADCTTVSFNGGGATASDQFGRAIMGFQGTSCAPKAVAVHVVVGAISFDVPLTLALNQ